jgi:hypothetical protein
LSARGDLGAVRKDELVWACEELGLPKYGTKGDLLVRLSGALGSSGRASGGGSSEDAGAGECRVRTWRDCVSASVWWWRDGC